MRRINMIAIIECFFFGVLTLLVLGCVASFGMYVSKQENFTGALIGVALITLTYLLGKLVIWILSLYA
mgnify:CR=1 FL=1